VRAGFAIASFSLQTPGFAIVVFSLVVQIVIFSDLLHGWRRRKNRPVIDFDLSSCVIHRHDGINDDFTEMYKPSLFAVANSSVKKMRPYFSEDEQLRVRSGLGHV
jgi:hypothetical protein